MAECPNSSPTDFGRTVAVGIAQGCGDDVFTGKTYDALGKINSKQLDFAGTTTSDRNDQSGASASTIISSTDATLQVSGFQSGTDSVLSVQRATIKYYVDELNAGRQPTFWVKVAGPTYPVVYYLFMVMTGYGEGMNTDDPLSINFNFSVTNTNDATNKSINVTDPV